MTTDSSFKPSAQFLEAGEKGQQFANAANIFKPLLPYEARQSIEGVDKVAKAFTATGQALEHFGFDELDPEATESQADLKAPINSEEIGAESRTLVPIPIPPYYYYSDINETIGADGLTGDSIHADAVGNSDVTPIGRFPYWDAAQDFDPIVGHKNLGSFEGIDQQNDTGKNFEKQIAQADVLNDESVGTDGVRWFPWSQGGIHPEWGNQDGYLDTAENLNANAFRTLDGAAIDPLA